MSGGTPGGRFSAGASYGYRSNYVGANDTVNVKEQPDEGVQFVVGTINRPSLLTRAANRIREFRERRWPSGNSERE